MEPSKDTLVTRNVKKCNYCGGIIDRHRYMFQCRDCGSYGDLVTGIMNPPTNKGIDVKY